MFNSNYTWIFLGDKLVGEVSRLVVAEACIQALDIDFTEGQKYEINSVQVIYVIDFKLQLYFPLLNQLKPHSFSQIPVKSLCFIWLKFTILYVVCHINLI